MTLTVKDTPELNQTGKPGAPSRNSETNPGQTTRSNPVCLEVEITIRSLPNEVGGLTQPIREVGRTVIVFDNGAVIRSTTNLPVGLKVILSNSRGRDVVCQVVGGRNAANIKGYVEVEFLETVNDFWRIHEDVGPMPVPVLPPPPLGLYETPDSLSPTSPFASTPNEAHAKAANENSGRAPSFEDIPGLVSTPIAPAAREQKNEPARPGLGITGNKDNSDYNLSEIADSTSLANWNQPASGGAVNRQGIPEKSETESMSSAKPAAARDFMSQGLMAYEQPSSSAGATNGKLQLIAGAVLLAVVAACGAAFYLRRASAPAPIARTEVQSQPSAPSPSAGNNPPESAPSPQDPSANSQSPAQSTAASSGALAEAQPAPPATPLPDIVLGPATTATGNARSEPRTAKGPEKKAEAVKQPEAASSLRPAIQNLKMSSPIAPRKSGANSGDAATPIADIPSTADAPATTPAGLLTSAGRTSKPPTVPPGEPAPAPASAARIISNPKLLSSTRVVYPPSAKQLNIQGAVTLVLTIDADGNVAAAKPLSGPLLLRQGAADSVKQWKYSPAMQDGKPVPSQVTISVDFHLN